VVTVGIDIIQYNMMPKHRSLIRYSSGICVGKEKFSDISQPRYLWTHKAVLVSGPDLFSEA